MARGGATGQGGSAHRGAARRSSATWLALAYAALVAYASLFPFTGWRWPPGVELARLVLLDWPPWRDDFDLWSNLGGYLPLGLLLLVAALRSGWRLAPALLLSLLAPAALSYGLEVLQQFVPGRHPSLKDFALNAAGAACGVALGLAGRLAGLDERWHRLRQRWFARDSAGALALLALWPPALLLPTPAPLGLGRLGPELREWATGLLHGLPWVERTLAEWPALAALLGVGASAGGAAAPAAAGMLGAAATSAAALAPIPTAHALAITALGLLAPCLLAQSVLTTGWRRGAGVLLVLLLALGGMTLSTLLNFGPRHALAWVTPLAPAALALAAAAALLLAPLPRRLAAVLGLMALTGLVTLVSQAPPDPFFAQNLAGWEQGRFARFHGLAQWLGWLWPFAAMAWLLGQAAAPGPARR